MRKIIAVPGQSVFDVALLYCGDAAMAYEIAMDNSIPITTTFENNTTLSIPDYTNNISKQYQQQGISFATGIIEQIVLDVLWLLAGGNWNDEGVWMDNEIWIEKIMIK